MASQQHLEVDSDAVRAELERIVCSGVFATAGRSRTFLRYVVERSLANAAPKEYEIAVEVLGRRSDYNPEINAAVRVEAGRLRQRLREFYETAEPGHVRIDVPKGAYAAVFTVAPAEPANDPEAAAEQITTKSPEPATALHEKRFSPAVFALGAGCLLLVVLLLALPLRNQRLQAAGPIRSLAVLPLTDLSGTKDEAYFAEGITDALTTDLAQTPNLRVVSRSSAMQVDSTKTPLRKIAAALDVDVVVEGTVVHSGDRVRITAQLIDARDDRHLWADSFEEKTGDVLSLQDTVAREIAAQTQAALTTSGAAPVRHPVNPVAYDDYLRGLYFLHRRDVLRSITYLRQATAVDPSYPAAHAALAEALGSEVTLLDTPDADAEPKARAEAQRAIELDPNSGEAYAALGQVEIGYAKNWDAARQDLQKSLALNPNDSLAEMLMSVYLDAMNKPEEAVAHMRRAVRLDPLSFFMNRHLGSTLYLARHYDEALEALRRAAEMSPQQIMLVDNWVSRSYAMKGDVAAAEAADLEGLRDFSSDQELSTLRTAYQYGGWPAYQAARLHMFARKGELVCDQFEMGESELRLGNLDRAFAAFERGMNTKCFWQDFLAVNPVMDPARADPRYAHLLQRAHLL